MLSMLCLSLSLISIHPSFVVYFWSFVCACDGELIVTILVSFFSLQVEDVAVEVGRWGRGGW